MTKETLEIRKQELMQQREQAIAQLNQIIGAIAIIDEMIQKCDIEEPIKKVKE